MREAGERRTLRYLRPLCPLGCQCAKLESNARFVTYVPFAPSGAFPLLVQVSNSDTQICFETSFQQADVTRNLADKLKLTQK